MLTMDRIVGVLFLITCCCLCAIVAKTNDDGHGDSEGPGLSFMSGSGGKRKVAGPKYCLGRIVGSRLPGRHLKTQTDKSLVDILENEHVIAGRNVTGADVHRFWLLNRMQLVAEEDGIRSVLAAKDPSIAVVTLPFVAREFRSSPMWRNDVKSEVVKYLPRAIALQARYLTANNEARNAAIDYCMGLNAEWILPLDGNIMIPDHVWVDIEKLTDKVKDTILLPMIRTTDNYIEATVMHAQYQYNASLGFTEEPQVMFHSSTVSHFDPRYMYGNRPKISMLRSLCVKGYWDAWIRATNYDMDFAVIDAPCSLRTTPPPILTSSSVLRINDKKTNAHRRHELRHRGVRQAVRNTIVNTMDRPLYIYWDHDYVAMVVAQNPKYMTVLPEAVPPTLYKHEVFRHALGNLTLSAMKLRWSGPLNTEIAKAPFDDVRIIRDWVLNFILGINSYRMSTHLSALKVFVYASDAILYLTRRKDIFKTKDERKKIQNWFHTYAKKCHLTFEKKRDFFHKRGGVVRHAEFYKLSSVMYMKIATVVASPWVTSNVKLGRRAGGDGVSYNNTLGDDYVVTGLIAEGIMDLADAVDVLSLNITGMMSCAPVAAVDPLFLKYAIELVQRHGFLPKVVCPDAK